MERYRIKIIKKYKFDLSGENKEDINSQVNTIMNESHILDLPYVTKNIRVKIRKIRKEYNDEKNS
ncbi:MAG: hypothetical protein E7313_08080 [Clostridiales bacterium]|nr:hypothetical protein [Clostridiales bacterium]